jgi:hypothetical protein
MARSDREEQYGRKPRTQRQRERLFDEEEVVSANRVFRVTDEQRQQVAKCLRYIDDARRALENQQNPANREIIRELRASADRIFDLLNDLEETGG